MKNSPRITIITASFNSEKTIKLTFNSILNQTYVKPFEYIVIDGGSNDETVNIIREYQSKFKLRGIDLKWISEQDTGIYNAWNKGLEISTGDWIAFLGSDDRYRNNALEVYAKHLIEYIDFDFIASKVCVVDDLDRQISVVKYQKIIFTNKTRWFPHPGAFHNSKLFKIYGNFNENFKIAGDLEFLTRIDNIRFYQIDQYLVDMLYGGVSSKSESKWNILKEVKIIQERNLKINPVFTGIMFYYEYCKSLLRLSLIKIFGIKNISKLTIFFKSK